MTKATSNSDKSGNDADTAAAAVTVEDLDLLDPGLEDETKTDEEIFDEIGEDEDAAVAAASGTDTIEEQLESGRAAQPAAAPAPTAEEEAATVATKLWDGASEGAVAAFDAANAKIEDLEQKDRSHRGRFSTMQKQLNGVTAQLQRAADKDTAAAGDADEGTAVDKVLKSEAWKGFEAEYGEIAAPLREAVAALQADNAATGTKVDAISAESADAAAGVIDAQITLLEKDHADWRDVAEDQVFRSWVEDQPKVTRDAAARNAQNIVDAGEVAEMMGHFKAFRSEQAEIKPETPDPDAENAEDKVTVTSLADKRQRQQKAAAGARPKGAPVASGIPDGDDEKAIWDAIDRKEAREAAQA